MTDHITPELAEAVLDVLSEANVEIFNADGAGNIVAKRIREVCERVVKSSSAPLASADRATPPPAALCDCTEARNGAEGVLVRIAE